MYFQVNLLGSYIDGVYCEIRLPRFLVRFLIFAKEKTTCSHGCGLIESFTVHYCGLITLPVLWLVFVIFLSRVMGCIIFEKTLYFENKNLY